MNFLRQLDILNPELIIYPVTIVGAGGIGSPTAFLLSKMGCKNITLYDFDTVEEHNRPNQIFRAQDEGKSKTEAMKEIIGDFAEWCEINTISEKIEEKTSLSGIVISAVDSMKSRKTIWESARYNTDVPLYFDGRIGGEFIEVYIVRPCRIDDVEEYEDSLFSDEEADERPCTEQGIIYTGMGVAVHIAAQLKKWLKGEECNRRIAYDFKKGILILE